ncbi:MAG: RNA polymerase sigma-70 factor [Proteobacteria bacterium]|nr:MAG: RNA polymerase sigma-70 factor [Pseudomonadota bacterium]
MPDGQHDKGSLSIQAVRDGEESAFNQLFRQHFRALSFFAHSIIGQELYAQDIVQECFIKVWSRRTQLTDLVELKSYLYAAVKNDCINYLRRQAVRDKKQEAYLLNSATEEATSVDPDIIRAETVQELYARIEQLPEKMREVIKLYYLEGKSSGEIGRLLQKDPDTIQHQRQSALRWLRKLKSVFF